MNLLMQDGELAAPRGSQLDGGRRSRGALRDGEDARTTNRAPSERTRRTPLTRRRSAWARVLTRNVAPLPLCLHRHGAARGTGCVTVCRCCESLPGWAPVPPVPALCLMVAMSTAGYNTNRLCLAHVAGCVGAGVRPTAQLRGVRVRVGWVTTPNRRSGARVVKLLYRSVCLVLLLRSIWVVAPARDVKPSMPVPCHHTTVWLESTAPAPTRRQYSYHTAVVVSTVGQLPQEAAAVEYCRTWSVIMEPK